MKKIFLKIRTNKVMANSGWLIGERIFQMFVGLFVNMFIARYLGANNYGIISYAGSFIAFLIPVCTLGIDSIVVNELIKNPERQGEVLGSGIFMRVVSSFLGIISIIFILMLLHPGDTLLVWIAFLQAIALVFRAVDLIEYWYQSQLQSKYVSLIKSFTYIIMVGYKIAILLLNKDISWFAFSTSLDIILISILLILSYKKKKGQKLQISRQMCIHLLGKSYHFILSGLMVVIYGQMDRIMLGQMVSTEAVGLYTVAIFFVNVWNFIPMAIITSLRPTVIQAYEQSQDLYERKLTNMYSIVIWLSIAYSLFITVFAKIIVGIMYGPDFMGAVTPLRIAVWFSLFSLVGVARDVWMICEEKQNYAKWFAFAGAVINLILNLLLIPQYGIIGSAVATLLTQITTGFVITLVFKDTRINNQYLIDAFLLKYILWKRK